MYMSHFGQPKADNTTKLIDRKEKDYHWWNIVTHILITTILLLAKIFRYFSLTKTHTIFLLQEERWISAVLYALRHFSLSS